MFYIIFVCLQILFTPLVGMQLVVYKHTIVCTIRLYKVFRSNHLTSRGGGGVGQAGIFFLHVFRDM